MYRTLMRRLNLVLKDAQRGQLHLHALIDSPIGLSPWEGWLVLCLIRRSLRSVIPNNRIEMAAALAIIDLPWCHNELARVLNETSDQVQTTECRTALLESRIVDVHAIVHNWEAENPYEEPDDESLAIGYLAQQRRDAIVRFEIQTLHDRAIVLRGRFRPGAADE